MSHPFICQKCGGATGLGHVCIKPELPKCEPPTHPGFWWIRHADPLKGDWQPVLVMRDNGLVFKKFWWSGHMAVSEAEKLGMEWGPECIPPPRSNKH